eukprot:TRINITY_DN8501_c0_g6_i1.p1 TRINITY_DN8501_c0_g6~~TRINITY_DN8501_c0_g6_i1.p1  ORF type:complete len:150 (+),score=38.86 TRINITY_DN8501_c0_g6_i1:518-967(+)
MLLSNANSTVVVYISSHAGEEFIKIQDTDVISTEDFARAIMEMHIKGRYKRMFIFLETCRAFTFFKNMKAPNVFAVASSDEGEDTKSHAYHSTLGLSINDIFSHHFMDFMNKHCNANSTLADIYYHLRNNVESATVKYMNNLGVDMSKV